MSTIRLLNPATTAELMPAFEAFIAALIEQFNPRQVIWFGSRARGQGHDWSDFDLLIEMDDCRDPLSLAGKMLQALDPAFAVDLVVRDSASVRARLAAHDSFLEDAYSEGKLLYAKPTP